MQREALRTLYSLTSKYQRHIHNLKYEVIVIDNGSTKPLDEKWINELGDEFRYIFFKAKTPSPCEALNYGVQIAHGKHVMLCIDGARILSPNILHLSYLATKMYATPFVYTLSMHIGKKLQNLLVEENYSQAQEDQLLNSIQWQADGYNLFEVSTLAGSSKYGYFSQISESNCFLIPKYTYTEIGGFDQKFSSPGGGLANLDFFNRLHEIKNIDPIMLLGEATFHQFHGGTATNVPMKDHPWEKMAAEYLQIRGIPYQSIAQNPTYFGKVHSKCLPLISRVA
jgi:glycosyltransferase involved in cell wall biosynthesis